MILLGGVWKGATGNGGFLGSSQSGHDTDRIILWHHHLDALLRYSIVRALKVRSEETSKRSTSLARKKMAAYISAVAAVGIILVNFFIFHSVALFVTDGVILISCRYHLGWLYRSKKAFSFDNSISQCDCLKTLFANKKQAMLIVLALSMGVNFMISTSSGFGTGEVFKRRLAGPSGTNAIHSRARRARFRSVTISPQPREERNFLWRILGVCPNPTNKSCWTPYKLISYI